MILEAPTVHFGLNPAAFNAFLAGPVGSIGLTIILLHPAAQLKCSGGDGDTLYHLRLHSVSFYNGEKLNTGFIEEFAPCVLGRTLLSVCRGQMVAVPPPFATPAFRRGACARETLWDERSYRNGNGIISPLAAKRFALLPEEDATGSGTRSAPPANCREVCGATRVSPC